MAYRHGFFDSVDGDRIYTADEFSKHMLWSEDDGFVLGFENGLEVVPNSPADNTVFISTGAAFLDGRFFQVYSSPVQLTVPTAPSSSSRRDRVILRIDYANREIVPMIKQGTAGSTIPPSLQRDSQYYEISLAYILVDAGETQYSSTDIHDERFDPNVCGIAKPHSFNGGLRAAAKYTNSTSISMTSGSSTDLTWDTTVFDTHGLKYSPYDVRVPIPGKYLIMASVTWAVNSNGVRILQIIRNSTRLAQDTRAALPYDYPVNFVQCVAELEPTDTVFCRVLQNSGTSLNVLSASAFSPVFSVHMISD